MQYSFQQVAYGVQAGISQTNLDSEESTQTAAKFCRGKEKDAKIETGRKRVGGAEETFVPTEEKSC